jgi:hypothetical protein
MVRNYRHSEGVTSVFSETVFDPSGFAMVVVKVVVKVPSGLRTFVTTSSGVPVGVAVAGMAVSTKGGAGGAGLFCKARVVQPEIAHKIEAMMHIIPAVSMEHSSASLQISEARATCNKTRVDVRIRRPRNPEKSEGANIITSWTYQAQHDNKAQEKHENYQPLDERPRQGHAGR